jgi:hypothetical protein
VDRLQVVGRAGCTGLNQSIPKSDSKLGKISSIPIRCKVGEPILVHAKFVFVADENIPVRGLRVRIDAIDEFGDPVDEALVRPSFFFTNDQGFNAEDVTAVFLKAGAFRLRLIHPDRRTTATSYTPSVIVLSSSAN